MSWFNWLHQAEVASQYLVPLFLAVALYDVSPWLVPVGLYVGWQIVIPIQVVVNTVIADLFYDDPADMARDLEEADKAFWGEWLQKKD